MLSAFLDQRIASRGAERTYSIKPGGRRYRYYASQAKLKGQRSTASISRAPATALESLVTGRLAKLGLPAPTTQVEAGEPALSHIKRIQIMATEIVVTLDHNETLAIWQATSPTSFAVSDLMADAHARLSRTSPS